MSIRLNQPGIMTKRTDTLIAHGMACRSISLLLAALLVAGWTFSANAVRSVTLAWNPSISPNVAGYFVYTLEERALLPSRQDAGLNSQATVNGLKEGLGYRFSVTAYNGLGLESLPSAPVHYLVPVPLEIFHPTPAIPYARLRFPVAPGRWYELQSSSNLKTWTTIWQTGVVQVYTAAEFQDTRSNTSGQQFYRLIIH